MLTLHVPLWRHACCISKGDSEVGLCRVRVGRALHCLSCHEVASFLAQLAWRLHGAFREAWWTAEPGCFGRSCLIVVHVRACTTTCGCCPTNMAWDSSHRWLIQGMSFTHPCLACHAGHPWTTCGCRRTLQGARSCAAMQRSSAARSAACSGRSRARCCCCSRRTTACAPSIPPWARCGPHAAWRTCIICCLQRQRIILPSSSSLVV